MGRIIPTRFAGRCLSKDCYYARLRTLASCCGVRVALEAGLTMVVSFAWSWLADCQGEAWLVLRCSTLACVVDISLHSRPRCGYAALKVAPGTLTPRGEQERLRWKRRTSRAKRSGRSGRRDCFDSEPLRASLRWIWWRFQRLHGKENGARDFD